MRIGSLLLPSLSALPLQGFGAIAKISGVSPWMMLPFALLLLAISLGPFLMRRWWDRYYPLVSLGLGLFVLVYYAIFLDVGRVLGTLVEYFSFIVLIGSLYTVSGGIFLHTERHATPWMNTLLLAIGALVSNVLGTTGASVLLIRPFLRTNRPRVRGFHVVFFIFIVSNMGGALTPIGDPPLLLGYLNGIPFTWTLQKVWSAWLLALALVLATFFLLDTYSYRKWSGERHRHFQGAGSELRGTHNFVFLFIILAAIFAATPVREIIMIAATAAAHRFAGKDTLRANQFTFAPIREVAILFAGIFATMAPALDWMALHADRLGIQTPGHFFWCTGILSSFLDNAPTYLSFLSAAMGLHHLTLGNPEQVAILLRQHADLVRGVSLGAVFFGAITYVGNGPNFMIKSIAEHAGIKCPSFIGYILCYSLPVLLPVFTLIWFLFLH